MILRLAAVVCLATALAACGGNGGETSSRDAYTSRNLDLLATLPLPDGTRRLAAETEDYEPTAYATNGRFRAPRGTTARALAAFYTSRLQPEWQLVERSVFRQPTGNSIIVLGFRRGDAGVWVNTADLYVTGQFELIVDHRGWEHRG